jgi:cytochrome c
MRQSLKAGFGLLAATAVMVALSGNAWAQDAAAGEKSFKKYCTACHALPSLGQNRVGPSLKGVVGRVSGTAENFSYSAALKGSGITWTEDKLETWLTSPKDMVPGTKMTFAGIKDAAERANVIAFLKAN